MSPGKTSLEDDLTELERGFWTGGPDYYREHVDKDCLVVFAEMAGIQSRDSIAKTAEAGRWQHVRIEPVGLVTLSAESVVFSYEASAIQAREPHRALCSSAYVKRQDGWKLAFHQQTKIDTDEEE